MEPNTPLNYGMIIAAAFVAAGVWGCFVYVQRIKDRVKTLEILTKVIEKEWAQKVAALEKEWKENFERLKERSYRNDDIILDYIDTQNEDVKNFLVKTSNFTKRKNEKPRIWKD